MASKGILDIFLMLDLCLGELNFLYWRSFFLLFLYWFKMSSESFLNVLLSFRFTWSIPWLWSIFRNGCWSFFLLSFFFIFLNKNSFTFLNWEWSLFSYDTISGCFVGSLGFFWISLLFRCSWICWTLWTFRFSSSNFFLKPEQKLKEEVAATKPKGPQGPADPRTPEQKTDPEAAKAANKATADGVVGKKTPLPVKEGKGVLVQKDEEKAE
jgi:hypothetical protein